MCHGTRVKCIRDKYETYRNHHEIYNKEFIENYYNRLGIINGNGLEYMVDTYTVYYAKLKRNIDIRQECLFNLI